MSNILKISVMVNQISNIQSSHQMTNILEIMVMVNLTNNILNNMNSHHTNNNHNSNTLETMVNPINHILDNMSNHQINNIPDNMANLIHHHHTESRIKEILKDS